MTVNWSTADGTAVAPSDYTTSSGTVTFVPCDTSETITVPVRGDTDVEPNETFQVDLATPSNATIADGSATGTIQNDDVAPPTGPTVSVGDAAIWEGDTKIRTVLFPVTLDVAATSTVSVSYRVVAGSATGGKVDIDNYRRGGEDAHVQAGPDERQDRGEQDDRGEGLRRHRGGG